MSSKPIIVVSPDVLRRMGDKLQKEVAELDEKEIDNKLKQVFGYGRISSTQKYRN